MKVCPDCEGTGVVEHEHDEEQQCPKCGGTGFVSDDDDGDGREAYSIPQRLGLGIALRPDAARVTGKGSNLPSG